MNEINLEPGIPLAKAAEVIGVSIQTVRREIDRGNIESYRASSRILLKTSEVERYRRERIMKLME